MGLDEVRGFIFGFILKFRFYFKINQVQGFRLGLNEVKGFVYVIFNTISVF